MGCKKLTYRRETPILKVAYRSAKTRANTCTGTYKFGFNGMESVDEISGSKNHYTTYWRQYDPRIGRWWSLEPKPVAWESGYAAFRNNPVYYSDPNGDWVKGAGFFKNVFNSDAKINAQAQAKATGGVAFKDNGGWTVNYQTKGPDLGNGAVTLPTTNVEHYANKPGVFSKIGNWWNNTELFFRAEGKIDVGPQAGIDIKLGSVRAQADLTLMNFTLIGGSIEQRGSDYNPYEFEFDYLGEGGYLDVEQQAGIVVPFVAGAEYEHSFEGRINGGYRNEKHTTTVNAAVIEGQVQRNAASGHTNVQGSFTIGGRLSLGLGIEGNVSFGVKEKR